MKRTPACLTLSVLSGFPVWNIFSSRTGQRRSAVCVASQSLRGIRGEIPQLTASMTATQIADPLMDLEVGEAAQHY